MGQQEGTGEGTGEEGTGEEGTGEEGTREGTREEGTNDDNDLSPDMDMYEFEEEEEEGGAKKKQKNEDSASNSITQETSEDNLDGVKLREGNNNLFLKRMKKRDPVLFLTKRQGNYGAYSTKCQPRSRHPVIISNEEKEIIDKYHRDSYTEALQYGSTPDKQNWYICPRYWCLKSNTSLTEAQAKDPKVCGKIIPQEATEIPPGHYVYEFTGPLSHMKKGKYVYNTPKFLEDEDVHPDGYRLPCCFKTVWNTKKQMKAKKQYLMSQESDINATAEPGGLRQQISLLNRQASVDKNNNFILKIEAYPIQKQRMGFLPLSVAAFLKTNNTDSVEKDNKSLLRKNTKTLLRYGVEQNSKKSFIGCLADIYSSKMSKEDTVSIAEMCDIIANSVSIDIFVRLHNGALVSVFKPRKYSMEDIDTGKYNNSKFLDNFDMSIESHEDFIHDTIASYENFIRFLKDPDSDIDHTYLWDIVCSSNTKLFITGMNLIIINILENDITDNIEIICPTTSYSSSFYDEQKESLILIKHDEFYEPIYFFENNNSKLSITKTFFEELPITPIKETMQIIKNTMKKSCKNLPSMPEIYEFKENIDIETLKTEVLRQKYKIIGQVLNYQGKVIGLRILEPIKNIIIFIPSAPSAVLPEIETIFMDDDRLWTDYETTRDILKIIHNKSNGRILCKPRLKVIEDELVVGIITDTNQFIMVTPPVPNTFEDGIPSYVGENYITADKALTRNNPQEEEREFIVKMILLETQFYSVFRSTIRILLNRSANKSLKQSIVDIIRSDKYYYKDKLILMQRYIHRIMDSYIDFQIFDKATLMMLDEITDCFSSNSVKKYCMLENGFNRLILPEKHLVSGKDNKDLYFLKVSDELLRYKRIQLFMLDPKIFLNISSNDYNIADNEMILLQTFMTTEYFDKLIPYKSIEDSRINYDMANPIKTQNYSNVVSLKQQSQLIQQNEDNVTEDTLEIECIKETRDIIGNTKNFWKRLFPKQAKELVLNTSKTCSYYLIIYIFFETYKSKYGKKITIDNVKESLLKGYSNYTDKYFDKILNVLKNQGKQKMLAKVLDREDFELVIKSDSYYLSNLDLWILAVEMKLPIILFSSIRLKNLIPSVEWIILNRGSGRSFFFVRNLTDPVSKNFIPEYNLIDRELKLDELPELKNMIVSDSPEYKNNMISITSFLQSTL